jgi:hypothetical protein
MAALERHDHAGLAEAVEAESRAIAKQSRAVEELNSAIRRTVDENEIDSE